MVLLFAIMSYMDTGHEFSPKMQTSPADKAAPICRSLLYREDAKQNFNLAAQMAIANGKAQLPIDAEKFGRYSMIAMRDTVKDNNWENRFMNAQRIQRTNQIFASFYKSVQQRGALTITELAALYDQLSINEVLLDGNTRNRVLALTHITTQYGYPPPDFNRAPHSKLIEMLKKYPTDHRKATVEFLREALPIMPLA